MLRAVHSELDWCVRNSYSPHHHENIGRCVLHAAHISCAPAHQVLPLRPHPALTPPVDQLLTIITCRFQGESYLSIRLEERDDATLRPELADAVTARPASPAVMHRLHAYVSRVICPPYGLT